MYKTRKQSILMMSSLVVVSKLCLNNIKMTNVSRKDKLLYKKNFDSQVLVTWCRTHWNLSVYQCQVSRQALNPGNPQKNVYLILTLNDSALRRTKHQIMPKLKYHTLPPPQNSLNKEYKSYALVMKPNSYIWKKRSLIVLYVMHI